MNGPVRRHYEIRAADNHLVPDSRQRELADRLDFLAAELHERELQSKRSSLGWLFARGRKLQPVSGLYIWGPVGRGKTMLMDVFHDDAPVGRKLRIHFHEFMADVHDRIHHFRHAPGKDSGKRADPIGPVAEQIAQEARLISFDEFSVNDIADAMILGRLFQQLLDKNVTIVATSNTPPSSLYKDGLNRSLFLPFIDLITKRMDVFQLDAPRDFRLEKMASNPVYVTPPGLGADRILDQHFLHLTGSRKGESAEIALKGRTIHVPQAAAGIARFHFDDLCKQPLGASDYLKLARTYHTIIISDIPLMDERSRNEAKRFINLIDTLYDNGTKLIVSAAAAPDKLWAGTNGHEAREFPRAASRLHEMGSDAYIGRRKQASSQ